MKTYYMKSMRRQVINHFRGLHTSREKYLAAEIDDIDQQNRHTLNDMIKAVMSGKVIYTVTNDKGYKSYIALHRSTKNPGQIQVSFYHIDRAGQFIPIMDGQHEPADKSGIYRELRKGCYIEHEEART